MALFFIVIVAIAVTALITFAGGALLNTANLKTQRSLEYAADSATDIAIQAVRYGATAYDKITGSPLTSPVKCFGPATLSTTGPTTPAPTSNKRTVVVYCKGSAVLPLAHRGPVGAVSVAAGATSVKTATLFGGSTTRYVGYKLVDSGHAFPTTATIVIKTEQTTGTVTFYPNQKAALTVATDTLTVAPIAERTVTFFTCVAKGTVTPTCPQRSGKPNYTVHATVAFNDVNGKTYFCGAPNGTTVPATPTCGTAMDVRQWVVQPANG